MLPFPLVLSSLGISSNLEPCPLQHHPAPSLAFPLPPPRSCSREVPTTLLEVLAFLFMPALPPSHTAYHHHLSPRGPKESPEASFIPPPPTQSPVITRLIFSNPFCSSHSYKELFARTPAQEKNSCPLGLDALRLCSEVWAFGILRDKLRRHRPGEMRPCHIQVCRRPRLRLAVGSYSCSLVQC